MQSLLPKIDECRLFLQRSPHSLILGLSETWLSDSITDAEVAVDNYTIFRKDRGSRGGGVAIYIPQLVRCFRRLDLELDDVEALWVELRTNNELPILVGIAYRPPNAPVNVIDKLCDMHETATQEHKEVVVMGDFNLNMLSAGSCAQTLHLSAIECGLEQMVTQPTRKNYHSETLIDLLYVSHPDKFVEFGCSE